MIQLAWYARRASVAAVYTAAGEPRYRLFNRAANNPGIELHQLTSPETTYEFLDSLLVGSSTINSSVEELSLFSSYIYKSWKGILKSSGVF